MPQPPQCAEPTPVDGGFSSAWLPVLSNLRPETPAPCLQRACRSTAPPSIPPFTKTATITTLSARRRSGTSQGCGECIMALIDNRASEVGIALCHLPSLAIIITQYGDSAAFAKTLSFVFSRNPIEMLLPETALDGKFAQTLLRHFHGITVTGVSRRSFDEAQGAHRLLELMSTDEACLEVSNTDRYLCVAAANALIEFVEMTYNYALLPHTVRVQYFALENYMEVSRLSARALHLIAAGAPPRGRLGGQGPEQLAGDGKVVGGSNTTRRKGSQKGRKTFFRSSHDSQQSTPLLPLVEALNHTMTAMGRRLLRSTILQPLRDLTSIELRYDSVEWLRCDEEALSALRRTLRLLGGDDLERAISHFSHEPKVQTVRIMQQRIEAVMTLWRLLGAAIQLTSTLRRVLVEEAEEEEEKEEDDEEEIRLGKRNRSTPNYDGSSTDMYGDRSSREDSFSGMQLRHKRGRPGEMKDHHEREKRNFTAAGRSRRGCGRAGTTLLRKILETLDVCRMDEICAEIALFLDKDVFRATEGRGVQPGRTLVEQRAKRPGSAMLQVQQCFAVKPNLSGTLDAARYQYSKTVEAMFARTEELKQQYGVGSLRVACDSVRGYHLSYDARHDCNAPESVFLHKYSGGSHYALYHSSCTMMKATNEWAGTEVDNKGVTHQVHERDGVAAASSAHLVQNGYFSLQGQKRKGRRTRSSSSSSASSSPSLSPCGVAPAGEANVSSSWNFTKHQVRGNHVTCTTREMLVLRRNADDAMAEILHTQDNLVRSLIEYLQQRLGKLQAVCDGVAMLDLLVAFAVYSRLNACTRPALLRSDGPLGRCSGTYFEEARYPGGMTTANTIRWDDNANVLLLTGPNAAGKTTLLRQVGQLISMAQSGCLVPAKSAALQPCDRLIAHMLCDDLEDTNTSSFGKEMRELSYLCLHATRESIVLVDELGRRTAAREGTAIAWATVEFLVETGSRTVFATHFCRLTRLALLSSGGVKNVHLAVNTGCEREGDTTETVTKMPGKTTCSLRFEYRLLSGSSQVDYYGLRLAERVGFFAPALALAWELLPRMSGMDGALQVDCVGCPVTWMKEGMGGDEPADLLTDCPSTTTTAATTTCSSSNKEKNHATMKYGGQTDEDETKGKQEVMTTEGGSDSTGVVGVTPRLSNASGISSIVVVGDESVSSDVLQSFSLFL